MSEGNKPPELKLFTLEEANKMLPTVRGMLQSLRSRRYEIGKLEEKKAVEELSWLREDGTVSPKAREEVARLDELLRQEKEALDEALGRLIATGAQLKDLDEGLVDFLAERDGEVVCLCWKDGEERISSWHDLESGFAGRRPMDEF